MKLHYIYLLGFFIIFLMCNNKKIDSKKHIEKKENNSTQINYSYADSLRKNINFIIDNKNVNDTSLKNIVRYFIENEKSSSSFFPMNEDDYKLFYKMLSFLKEQSKVDFNALKLFLELSFIIRRNVEAAEYLMTETPNIAMNNIINLIKFYCALDSTKKKIIIENLEYTKDYDSLKQKLVNISNIELKASATEILTEIEKKK